MKPRESPKKSTSGVLRLFVYGTLKREYWNHDLCSAKSRSSVDCAVYTRHDQLLRADRPDNATCVL